MGDDRGLGIVFALGMLVGGVVGGLVAIKQSSACWREACIENGLAMYAPDTAEFVLFKADQIGHAPPAAEPEPTAD